MAYRPAASSSSWLRWRAFDTFSAPPGATIGPSIPFFDGPDPQSDDRLTDQTEGQIVDWLMLVYPSTFITGSAYKTVPQDASADSCSAACKADPICKAFTYVKGDFTPTRKPSCDFKSSATAMTPGACCISGIKQGAAPVGGRLSSGAAPGPAAGPQLAGAWSFPSAGGVDTVQVTQSGDMLTFVDRAQRKTQARIQNGKVVADAWKMEGTILGSGQQIRWSNGSLWSIIPLTPCLA